MRFMVNGFELEVIEEADGVSIRVRNSSEVKPVAPASRPLPPIEEEEPDVAPAPAPTGDLAAVMKLGLTPKTVLQIANKVLNFTIKGPELQNSFGDVKKASLQFLSRKIKDPIWALFVASISIPVLGEVVTAVGLNNENQLILLGIEKNSKDLYEDIISRGVKPKDIKVGVLSFSLPETKTFEKTFPNAQIQFDWFEYRDQTPGASAKALIGDAMYKEKETEVKKMLVKLKPPSELFTYFNFDKKLWRALRTTSSLKRIEKDLGAKLKTYDEDTEEAKLAMVWGLMRLQYQWYKVPADSEVLNNLKFNLKA
jgi:hypothetical protein